MTSLIVFKFIADMTILAITLALSFRNLSGKLFLVDFLESVFLDWVGANAKIIISLLTEHWYLI